MQHEWEASDDEVVTGAMCPLPECGALVVAFRLGVQTHENLPHNDPTTNATPSNEIQNRPSRANPLSCLYELYAERGREDGHDLDDRLQTESQVTQDGASTVRRRR
jgi:hypothetical protein